MQHEVSLYDGCQSVYFCLLTDTGVILIDVIKANQGRVGFKYVFVFEYRDLVYLYLN